MSIRTDGPLIVVTGGTGRIGESVRYVVDNEGSYNSRFLSRDRRFCSKFDGVWWDPSVPIEEILPNHPDTILHLAGATPSRGADLSRQDFVEANCNLTLAVLDAAKARSASRVLIISSASVYGRPRNPERPVSEDCPLSWLTDYAYSKICMESEVRKWVEANRAGPEVCILRVGNIAGADQLLQNAQMSTATSPLLLDKFESGRGPLRSYIGPLTLARTLLNLCEHDGPLPDCMNVAESPPLYMEDLLQAIGRKMQVFWKFKPAPVNAVASIELDVGRLAQVCGNLIDQRSSDRMIEEMFQLKDWIKSQ